MFNLAPSLGQNGAHYGVKWNMLLNEVKSFQNGNV
jgi:hypothetical protein